MHHNRTRRAIRLAVLALAGSAGLWAGQASAACSDGRDRNVTVVNQTVLTVRELYGSPATSPTWEEDVLGADVLPVGQSVRVDWDDDSCECVYDLKAVLSDGREVIARRFNVCTETSWRIR